jgi:hypothetical protein
VGVRERMTCTYIYTPEQSLIYCMRVYVCLCVCVCARASVPYLRMSACVCMYICFAGDGGNTFL